MEFGERKDHALPNTWSEVARHRRDAFKVGHKAKLFLETHCENPLDHISLMRAEPTSASGDVPSTKPTKAEDSVEKLSTQFSREDAWNMPIEDDEGSYSPLIIRKKHLREEIPDFIPRDNRQCNVDSTDDCKVKQMVQYPSIPQSTNGQQELIKSRPQAMPRLAKNSSDTRVNLSFQTPSEDKLPTSSNSKVKDVKVADSKLENPEQSKPKMTAVVAPNNSHLQPSIKPKSPVAQHRVEKANHLGVIQSTSSGKLTEEFISLNSLTLQADKASKPKAASPIALAIDHMDSFPYLSKLDTGGYDSLYENKVAASSNLKETGPVYPPESNGRVAAAKARSLDSAQIKPGNLYVNSTLENATAEHSMQRKPLPAPRAGLKNGSDLFTGSLDRNAAAIRNMGIDVNQPVPRKCLLQKDDSQSSYVFNVQCVAYEQDLFMSEDYRSDINTLNAGLIKEKHKFNEDGYHTVTTYVNSDSVSFYAEDLKPPLYDNVSVRERINSDSGSSSCSSDETVPELPPRNPKANLFIEEVNHRTVMKQESVDILAVNRKPMNMTALSEDAKDFLLLIEKMSSSTDPQEVYKFKRTLGEGGYGTVYKARIKNAGKELFVAIKYMDLKNNLDGLGYIAQEISIMRTLNHPNIVNFIKCHFLKESLELCLVMDYVEGMALNEIVEPRDGLSDETVAACILKQCVEGLDYMHNNNVIHRDIKSDNIFVEDSGRVKILDFGASAKLWSAKVEKRVTQIGTPYWMAPEVIKCQPYTFKVDVWSLGIMGYECFTGVPPYYRTNKSDHETMLKICRDGVKHLIATLRVSQKCRSFLERCCTRRVIQRASMGELKRHPFLHTASNLRLVSDLVKTCRALSSDSS